MKSKRIILLIQNVTLCDRQNSFYKCILHTMAFYFDTLLNKWPLAVRTLTSYQLYHKSFGDPVNVLECHEVKVPKLRATEVLVKMLLAPVHTLDMRIIKGTAPVLPFLPRVPGEEGVGLIEEKGSDVKMFTVGQKVILYGAFLGSWQTYGVYDERHLLRVNPQVPTIDASMLSIHPVAAYRMLRDFRQVVCGETIIQNSADSACGQTIIQLCKAWGINSINIIPHSKNFEAVKKYLICLGANSVYSNKDARKGRINIRCMNPPVLGLNTLNGKDEDVLLESIQCDGTVVYHGYAFDLSFNKIYIRPDLTFDRFLLHHWNACNEFRRKGTLADIMGLIVRNKLHAPNYELVGFENYCCAIRNTSIYDKDSQTTFILDMREMPRNPNDENDEANE